MKIIAVTPLEIPDVVTVRFARFSDDRGYFVEPFRRSDFDGAPGLEALRGVPFLQANESYSRKGVVRGLHFQWNPLQGKLVRTIQGRMIDLALDIRRGSPTEGRIIAHDMPRASSDPEGEWIYLPPGFAHGVVFLEDTTIEYFCTGEWSPGCEGSVSPLAPDLDWSLCKPALSAQVKAVLSAGPRLSDKDRDAPTFRQWSADPRAMNFVGAKMM